MKPPLQRLLEHLDNLIGLEIQYQQIQRETRNIHNVTYHEGKINGMEELQAWITANLPESTGDGWMPIETAPRDGTKILLFVVHPPDEYAAIAGHPEGWSHIKIGFWIDNADMWDTEHTGDPTHWRPLPEPPAGS